MIQFIVNREKVLAALLFLISEASRRGKRPSQYDLVKALFLGDKSHLNNFGRPITFDQYVAMDHGPVPSFSYNCLKPDFNWNAAFGIPDAPWVSEAEGKVHRFSPGNAEPDLRKLSKSDLDALSDAMGTILSLTFGQIRRLTHDERAYVTAWKDEEDQHAFPMDMGLLLDDDSDEGRDDLQYLAEITAA